MSYGVLGLTLASPPLGIQKRYPVTTCHAKCTGNHRYNCNCRGCVSSSCGVVLCLCLWLGACDCVVAVELRGSVRLDLTPAPTCLTVEHITVLQRVMWIPTDCHRGILKPTSIPQHLPLTCSLSRSAQGLAPQSSHLVGSSMVQWLKITFTCGRWIPTETIHDNPTIGLL